MRPFLQLVLFLAFLLQLVSVASSAAIAFPRRDQRIVGPRGNPYLFHPHALLKVPLFPSHHTNLPEAEDRERQGKAIGGEAIVQIRVRELKWECTRRRALLARRGGWCT